MQHQRLVGVGAAQEYAGRRARSAVGDDLHAGLALQQLGEALRAGARDFVAADDGHVGEATGPAVAATARQ